MHTVCSAIQRAFVCLQMVRSSNSIPKAVVRLASSIAATLAKGLRQGQHGSCWPMMMDENYGSAHGIIPCALVFCLFSLLDKLERALPVIVLCRGPDMLDVNVEWVDGTRHAFRMPRDANVTLSRREVDATGVPRSAVFLGTHAGVCADRSPLRPEVDEQSTAAGETSEPRPASDRPPLEFMAWGRRYSAHRSEAAASVVQARERATRERTRVALTDAGETMRALFRTVPTRTWVYLVLWLVLGRVFKYVGFGAPFFIASLIYLIFANLGTRAAGDSSATPCSTMGSARSPGSCARRTWRGTAPIVYMYMQVTAPVV